MEEYKLISTHKINLNHNPFLLNTPKRVKLLKTLQKLAVPGVNVRLRDT
jgi:hypothetical protein